MMDVTKNRICHKPTAIYTIITVDGRAYGGKTVDPTARLRKHRTKWPGCTMVVHRWLPVGDDWVVAERQHIAALRTSGAVVLNQNRGGGGPQHVSDETRARQAASQRARPPRPPRSPEHCEKIRQAALGRKMPQTTRDALSRANKGNSYRKGIPHTEATKSRLREKIMERARDNNGRLV